MPDFFINGQPVHAEPGQTVLQAALAAGHYIPYFCWHPNLSVAGNCRMCIVDVEDGKGGTWSEIACNMPIEEGMKVLTDTESVRARRKETLQLILLNHPVDCGICDKAGECMLQDQHYEYHGERPVSFEPKVTGDQVPLAVRAHRHRQRALHLLLALHALHRRGVRLAFAGDPVPRRPLAGACGRGRRLRPRPVLGQRGGHLPGRRAAVEELHVPLARLVPEADAVDLPGLRARLHRQHLAPQARVEAERARSAPQRVDRPRDAARESGRQRAVDLQQGPRPREDLRASARRAGPAEGQAGRTGGGGRSARAT